MFREKYTRMRNLAAEVQALAAKSRKGSNAAYAAEVLQIHGLSDAEIERKLDGLIAALQDEKRELEKDTGDPAADAETAHFCRELRGVIGR